MSVGRVKGHRRIGRFEPYFEIADSFLGPLSAAKVLSGPGEGNAVLVREVSPTTTDAGDRMLAAAKRAVGLTHAGLVGCVEAKRHGGGLHVAYDYVEAENLRSLHGLSSIRRHPFDLGVAIRIAVDLIEAVSAVYEALAAPGSASTTGVFGGIAPDSILVGEDGRTRLFDVGLGAVAAATEGIGDQSERVAYLAPEQVDNHDPGAATPRSDVFTLGVIVWELLSNRRLFIGSDRAVAQKVLAGKIPPLDKVKRRGDFELSKGVVALVQRALEREPEARFESPMAMLDALSDTGENAKPHSVVAELVKAVGESNIARRRDAMLDATGSTAPVSVSALATRPGRGAPPVAKPAAPAAKPAEPAAKPAEPAAKPAVPAAKPAVPTDEPAQEPEKRPKIMGVAVPPAVGASAAKPPLPTAHRALPRPGDGTRAKPRVPMKTMMGVAPPPLVTPGTPMPGRADSVKPEPSDEAIASAFPDSAYEPVGLASFGGPTESLSEPLEHVRPPVTNAADAGASWPVLAEDASPEPAAAEPAPAAGATPDAGATPREPHAEPRIPPAPAVPRDHAPALESPSRPAEMRVPASGAGRSVPPTALFASKVPPPLIHDPRAKTSARARQKKPAFASGVLVGTLAAIAVVGAGVGVGLYVVRSQQADMDDKRIIAEEAVAAALAAAAAASPPPATPASTPIATASAPPAVESATPPEPPREPDAAAAPEEAALPAAPLPTYRAPTRTSPTPKKKFVPDDI